MRIELVQAHDAANYSGVDLRVAAPASTALMSIRQLRDLRDTLTIVPTVADACRSEEAALPAQMRVPPASSVKVSKMP
jgi:hypothetical protein